MKLGGAHANMDQSAIRPTVRHLQPMSRNHFHRRPGTARDLVARKRPGATRPARRPPRPSPSAPFGRSPRHTSPDGASEADAPRGNGATADIPAPAPESPALRAFDRLQSPTVRIPDDSDADPDLLLDTEPRSPLRLLTTSRYSIPVVAGVLIAIVAIAAVIIFTGVSLQEAKDPDPTVARIPNRTAADLELTAAQEPSPSASVADAADAAAEVEGADAASPPAPEPSTAGATDTPPPEPEAVAPPPEEPATPEPPAGEPAEPDVLAPASDADPLAPLRDWPTVVTYTVQPGDDWAILGARFNTNANAIIAYNNITDPTHLFFGDVLQIPVGFPVVVTLPPVDAHDALRDWPRIATFTVTPATTLTALADEFLTTPAAILEYNQLDPAAPLPVGETLQIPWGFTLPLP